MYVLCVLKFTIIILLIIVHFALGYLIFRLCCSAIDSQLIFKDMGNYVGGVDKCVYVMCVVNVNVCCEC